MKDKKNLQKDAKFQSPQQQMHTGDVVLNPDQRKRLDRFSRDLGHSFQFISVKHFLSRLYNRLQNLFN